MNLKSLNTQALFFSQNLSLLFSQYTPLYSLISLILHPSLGMVDGQNESSRPLR